MKNKKTKYLRGAVLAMLLCGAFPSGVEGASKSIGVGIWNESFEIGYDDAQFTISTSPYYTLHISVNTAAVSSSSSSLVTGAQVYSYVTQAIADAGTGGGTSIVDYDTNYSTSNDHYLATKFGDTTWTPGRDSASYGYNAKATGSYAQAFGTNATASESYANAYGREASATGKYSNAYGYQANASGYASSAYGHNAIAQGESSGAYGHTATSTGFAAGAYGNSAKARGMYAGAYGAFAQANTNSSLALGSFATVGTRGVTTSDGVGGIAIGNQATVNITDDKGITSEMQYEAPNVTGDLAIAIGAGTSATKLDAVAIGVTSSATGQRAISFGAAAMSSGDNATALGNAAIASANYAGAYGYQAKASGVNAGAYGMQTVASGLNAGAYGSYAKAYTNYSLALGTYAMVGQSETATTTNGVGGIAIGSYGGSAETLYPAVYADYGIAIGTNARVQTGATYSTAVGYGAKTSTTQATALGYNAEANQTSSVALGAGSVTTEANSVSVGASTDATRTITNVTAGDSTKDAANWDQIAATGKTVTLSTSKRETVGTNNVQHNQIASNDGTVLATFTPMAAVSSGDNGFVSGAHLYAENRAAITGTSIVSSTATAGANLKALEQHLVKKMTYQVQDGTVTVYNNQYSGTGDATEAMVAFKLTGLGGDSSPVITDGKSEAETAHWVDLAMNGAADDASVTRGSNSAAYGYKANAAANNSTALGYNAKANVAGSVALGSASVVAAAEGNVVSVGSTKDNITRKIINVANGSQNTDAATYGQIVKAGQTFTLKSDKVTANIMANDDKTSLANITIGTGAIASTDTGFVDGKTVYDYDKPVAKTGYVLTNVNETASTGVNLGTLDAAIVDQQRLIKANTAKTQISIGNDTTFANVTAVDIGNGSARTLTGVKAGTENTDAANFGQLANGKNGTPYTMDDDGIITVSTNAGGDAFKIQISGNGSIANGNTQLITGGTAFTYLSPVQNGNYIKTGNDGGTPKTTGENLTLLDAKIGAAKTVDASLYAATDTVEDQILKVGQKAIKILTNAVSDGSTHTQKIKLTTYDNTSYEIEIAGAGDVASGDVRLVNGDTVYNYGIPVAKTGYTLTNVVATDSVGKNLGSLDAAIVDQQRLIKANDEKTQISIGNDTTFATVTSVDIGNGSTRTLTGVKAGTTNTDAANFGQLANGKNGTPYTMDDDGIITVSTNAGGDAFKIQISGNGSIANGNTQLITGGTAYAYLNPTTGSYVTSDATTAANLNALDNAIGTVSAGNYLVASGVTIGNNIAANLEKLDTAIGKTAAGHYIAAQDGGTTTVATNLKALDDALYEHAKLVKADNAVATSATKILVGSDAGFDNVSAISVFKADGMTTRKIEGVATGTETTDAATVGQILKKQVVTISQNNNTAYLYDHDENKVVEIVVEGLGEHGKSTSIVDFSTDAHWLSTDFDKQFNMKGTNSTAYGYGANAQGRASMALGKDAVAFAEEAVAIGAESTANAAVVTAEDGTKTAMVSFGHKKGDFTGWYYKTVGDVTTYSVEQEEGFEAYNYAEDKLSRLTNIAAGDADTDAVNVSQLKQAISDSAYRASDTITIDADRTIRATYMAVGDSVHLGLPKATGTDAMAVGIASQADGLYATALGVNSAAIGEQAVSVGLNNTVEARKATALGRDNQAKGDVSVALGNFNQAMGTSSTAVGVSNDIGTFGDGKQSTAVGYYNTVYGTQSTGVGYKNYIEANLSAGFGSQNTVYGGQSTAVGYNNKIGATTEADSTVVDTTKGNHTYVFGENNAVTANNALVFGSNVATVADRSVVIGDGSTSEDPNTVSVGSAALQRKIVHVADGSVNTDAATYGQLVKNQEYTFDANGVATIETNASTKENPQTAFILKLAASGSIDAGSGGYVTGAALYTELRPTSGKYVSAGKTTAENFVALDTQVKSNVDTIDTINTDVSGLKTDVSGMKTDISGLKTDVSTLDTRVTTIESSIGDISGKIDGTKVDGSDIVLSKTNNTATVNHADGSKAFSITIEGLGEGISPYVQGDGIEISDDNKISVKVGDDLTVNENGISVKKEGTVTSGSTGLVTGGAVYNAIEEKTGDMSKLKSAGLSDNLVDSVLTVNEKAAGIAADIGDTSKLAAAGIGDNLTDSVLTVNDKIGSLSDDINKVGAGAAALAALRPEGFDPGDKWSFAVGYGHYKNANAGALGAFFKPNADTTVSLGGTIGNGDSMMNMGVSFKLGARSKNAGVYRNAVELVQRVDGLESDIARETRRNDNQEALIAAQAQEIRALKAQVAVLMKRAGLTVSVEKAVTR